MVRCLVVVFVATACKAPPDAPEAFEALSAYLFSELGEGDDPALQAGVDNLAAWLAVNVDESVEGYTIDRLSQASLDALEVQRERDATRLVGGAVATVSSSTVEQLVRAFLLEDQTAIYPDDYDAWNSTFRSDPSCFVDGDCEELLVDNETVTRLPLGIRLTTLNTAQYRWVEADVGRTLLTRSWLQEPARSEPNLLQLDEQFFLSVNLPTERGLVRLQAVWADAAVVGIDLPDASALNLLVDGLRSQDETLYEWLGR